MAVRGVIAASEPHTARAGARILRAGGNAVDAIVAAKLTACVTEMPLTSLGGGGTCLWGTERDGFKALDFFAVTPGLGLMHRPELDFQPMMVDFGPTTQTYHVGRAAAAVPGELVGLLELHQRAGRLDLRTVVAPAVEAGREGFAVSPQIAMIVGMLGPIARRSPEVAATFFHDHQTPVAGQRLSNPHLADFLVELAGPGSAAALAGYWELLVREFGPERGGLLTRADVEGYRPVIREPLRVPFGRHEVLTNPPPSAGGGLIGIGLRIAHRMELGREPFLGAAHATAVASLLAAVSDARASGYDARLLSDPDAIRALVAGTGIEPYVATAAALREERSLGGTTHISVIDADGMAASMTTSNGEGCGHALPGLGVHVNNFLGEEDINPGGFHVFQPGTRMSTMMSPTIVLRDGKPRFVLGTGGSNRIRSAITQSLLNLLCWDRPLHEAVNAARMHVEGRKLWFEAPGLAPGVADALESAWPGAAKFEDRSMFFGGVHAVASEDGRLHGAGDERRGGVVEVASTP
jgi:gamma-glutamyltranspeptidase/glutathione hydrolase